MSSYEYTPTEFEARQVYAAGDVHLEAEFDRMIAVVERAAKAGALRDFANWIDRVYSDRLFPPPMEADYSEVHRALMVNRGVSLDRVSADLMRRAGLQARNRANRIEKGESV